MDVRIHCQEDRLQWLVRAGPGAAWRPLPVAGADSLTLHFLVTESGVQWGEHIQAQAEAGAPGITSGFLTRIGDGTQRFKLFGAWRPLVDMLEPGLEAVKGALAQQGGAPSPGTLVCTPGLPTASREALQDRLTRSGFPTQAAPGTASLLVAGLLSKEAIRDGARILVLEAGFGDLHATLLTAGDPPSTSMAVSLAGLGEDPRVAVLAELLLERAAQAGGVWLDPTRRSAELQLLHPTARRRLGEFVHGQLRTLVSLSDETRAQVLIQERELLDRTDGWRRRVEQDLTTAVGTERVDQVQVVSPILWNGGFTALLRRWVEGGPVLAPPAELLDLWMTGLDRLPASAIHQPAASTSRPHVAPPPTTRLPAAPVSRTPAMDPVRRPAPRSGPPPPPPPSPRVQTAVPPPEQPAESGSRVPPGASETEPKSRGVAQQTPPSMTFEAFAAQVRRDGHGDIAIRELVAMTGYSRRGREVLRQIRKALRRVKLPVGPIIEKGHIDAQVRFYADGRLPVLSENLQRAHDGPGDADRFEKNWDRGFESDMPVPAPSPDHPAGSIVALSAPQAWWFEHLEALSDTTVESGAARTAGSRTGRHERLWEEANAWVDGLLATMPASTGRWANHPNQFQIGRLSYTYWARIFLDDGSGLEDAVHVGLQISKRLNWVDQLSPSLQPFGTTAVLGLWVSSNDRLVEKQGWDQRAGGEKALQLALLENHPDCRRRGGALVRWRSPSATKSQLSNPEEFLRHLASLSHADRAAVVQGMDLFSPLITVDDVREDPAGVQEVVLRYLHLLAGPVAAMHQRLREQAGGTAGGASGQR